MEYSTMILRDSNGNTADTDYFGSEEEAQKALDSLTRCSDCSDCSRCFGCSGCFRCSRCSDCSDCSRCSRCSDCSDCSRCFGCFGCFPQALPAVPTIEHIHQKVMEAVTAEGCSLKMKTWHTCATAHCRAGWIVTLAGEEGAALEAKTSTEFAAMQILKASSPIRVSPVRFYESNEIAMEDIVRCAELEKESAGIT